MKHTDKQIEDIALKTMKDISPMLVSLQFCVALFRGSRCWYRRAGKVRWAYQQHLSVL